MPIEKFVYEIKYMYLYHVYLVDATIRAKITEAMREGKFSKDRLLEENQRRRNDETDPEAAKTNKRKTILSSNEIFNFSADRIST
jgi:hypothetical protein